MDWLLLAGASLLLFFVRDIVLLAASPASTRSRHWPVWAAVQLGVFIALGWIAESVPRERAYAFLREPFFWMPAVAIHGVLWMLFTWARRRNRPGATAAWIALLPPPMFVFGAGALVWLALTRTGHFEGWSAGAAVGVVWIASVLSAAAWRSRTGANAGVALQFAATTNLSATLLIPIQQSSDTQSGIAEQPIDWIATLLPLGLVASLILLSFLFHRFRSARRAA
jgi:hypothetical protein